MIKIVLFLFVVLFIPNDVNAYHEVIDSRCTNSLKISLRETGRDVVYRLSRVENEDEITYTAYFYNLNENIYISNLEGTIYYDNKIDNIKPGETFMINIYASDKTYCSGYKVLTKTISVPYYNPYFGSEYCSGYENYSLCKENVDVKLSKEEFIKRINEYKETLEKNEKEEVLEEIIEEENFNLFDFVLQNIYYFLIIIFIIVIGVITILFINKTKNRGIL